MPVNGQNASIMDKIPVISFKNQIRILKMAFSTSHWLAFVLFIDFLFLIISYGIFVCIYSENVCGVLEIVRLSYVLPSTDHEVFGLDLFSFMSILDEVQRPELVTLAEADKWSLGQIKAMLELLHIV